MADTAIAVMTSKLSASDGVTVEQKETLKTCNAKGKTSELHIPEEKRTRGKEEKPQTAFY